MVRILVTLTLLLLPLTFTVRGHQGALHPTNLPLCDDLLLALSWFHLAGDGVEQGPPQDPHKEQEFRIINDQDPGLPPQATVQVAWALYGGHPVAYSDYTASVSIGNRSIYYANAHDMPTQWIINPYLHGWQGMFSVTVTHNTCDVSYVARGQWNFNPTCAKPPPGVYGPGSTCLSCSMDAKVESVHLTFPIGVVDHGKNPIALAYESELLPNQGIANLAFKGPEPIAHPDLAAIAANDLLTSVECDDFLARVIPDPSPDDPDRFRITVSSDKLDPDNTIFRETTVENVLDDLGAVEVLRVTEVVTGRTRITEYSQPDPATWVMVENDARRTTRTVLSESPTEKTTRIEVAERAADTSWVTVTMVDETESLFSWGLQLTSRTVDPLGKALTTSWDYYNGDEFSGPNNDRRGRSLLKSYSTPEGMTRTIQYFDTDPLDANYDQLTVTTENHADQPTGRVTRLHTAWNSPFVTELHETLLNGQLVSKKEVTARADLGGRYRLETDYPSATGPGLVTRIDFDQNPYSPLLEKTTFPDNTVEVIEEQVTGGLETRTVWRGTRNSSGIPIRTGRAETVVRSKAGQVLHSSTVSYQNKIAHPVEERLADPTTIDYLSRPLAYDVFHGGMTTPSWRESLSYGCCGLESQSGRDGLTISYFYDALDRLRKIHRNGLSTETIYDGLTLATHLYPEGTPNGLSFAAATNLVTSFTRDLGGDLTTERYRSPQDDSLVAATTTTAYQPGGGLGRRVTRTLPAVADDLGVPAQSVAEYFPDGLPAKRSGSLLADRSYGYGATAEGPTATLALLNPGGSTEQPVTTQYDWLTRPVQVTYASDFDGDTVLDHETLTYDDGGRVLAQTDADGVTTLFAYDLTNSVTTSALDLDGNGVLDLNLDQAALVTRSFDTNGDGDLVVVQEAAVRDKIGASHLSRLVSRTEATPDGLSAIATTYHQGNAITTRTHTTIDPTVAGKWTTTTEGAEGTTTTQQFLAGLLRTTTVVDSTGAPLLTRGYTYDAYQRATDITDSSGPTVHRDYDLSALLDLPSAITLGGTRTTAFAYDHRGRRTTVDEPDTVDHLGNPVPNIRTITYYPHGQPRETNGTPGYHTSHSYDHALRPETLTTYGTTPAVTRWEYEPLRGLLVGKKHNSPTPGTGTGPSYTYTPAGRLETRLNARGTTTTHQYDAAGRFQRLDYDDGLTPSVVHNTYDRLGRPTSLTDGAGTRTLSYTELNQPATTSYQSDSPLSGWDLTHSYDGLARLSALSTEFTPGGGSASAQYQAGYGYDPAGRMESVTAHGLVNWLHYHPTKQQVAQTTISDDHGPFHYGSKTFDALNRLERVSYHNGLPATSNFQVHSDYHYLRDALGRITSATLADQTQWRYAYKASGELATATRHLDFTLNADRVLGHSLSYDYDGLGNRTASRKGGDADGNNTHLTTYTPNALNQYSTVGTPSLASVFGEAPESTPVTVNGTAAARQGPWFYREEAANNASGPDWHAFTITDPTGSESGNLLVAPATVTPSYDLDGNLLHDGKYSYTWDAESRLIALAPAAGSPQPYFRLAYTYDAQGRRVLREEFDTPTATTPVTVTKYLFAGWRCLGEADGNDALQKSYVWGVDQGDAFHLGDPNGALLWIHDHPSNETHLASYDGNGNLTALTSAQTKQPTAAYHYSPFGELLCQTGPYAKDNPFKFSTQHHDPTTNFPYYGHRWLDPEHGRWLNRDPIEEVGGLNLYGFVGNDGVNGFDALGLINCDELKEALLMAKLANAAYKDRPPPGGWKEIDNHDDIVGTDWKVFENAAGEQVIAFRGTEPGFTKGSAGILDWLWGNSQAVGVLANQYAVVAGADGAALAAKYPNAKVVGHSLGGGLASMFGTMYQRETHTFNSAGLHKNTLARTGITQSQASNYVTAHYVRGEILSGAQDHLLNNHPIFGDLTPGAYGLRVAYTPDLFNNNPYPEHGLLGLLNPKFYWGKALRDARLPVTLHGMDEVIEAILRRIRKCCP